MVEGLFLLVFLVLAVALPLLLWQAVQGEGRGETMDRRSAERAARRDDADDEATGWGEAARRDVRDQRD